MTVLAAAQQAAPLMGMTAPASLVSATDSYARELLAIANEAAPAIAKAHDWRKLTVLNTIAGDGAATAFNLPTNYDRMPIKAAVFSSRSRLPLSQVDDLDTWLDLELQGFVGTLGAWIMLGGQIHIRPTLAVGENAKFYYISNETVSSTLGALKTAFTLNDDVYRLSERLLGLFMAWRWRQVKGLDYAEDLQNYQIAFGEEAGRDKGARIIKVGTPRMSADVAMAWPGTIVP